MSEPIRRLNRVQFAQLLDAAVLTRAITGIHLHHTKWLRQAAFRGGETLQAMQRQHVETFGWPDIAQHLTIDPYGGIWTGRNWNLPPASVSGHNGTAAEGPLMIELVGDFDKGADALKDAQREAAVDVFARVLRKFGLKPTGAVVWHRDLDSAATCPGTTVNAAPLEKSVQARIVALAREARKGPRRLLFAAEHLAGASVVRPAAADQRADAEVPEGESAARELEQRVRARVSSRQQARARVVATVPGRRDASEWAALKPHVINLSRGELSEGGEFSTSPVDLDGIVDRIRAYAAAVDQPNVLLYAHGGLVDERAALEYADTVRGWWMNHGVYPVFFVWESGLLETLRQYIIGPRALSDASDTVLEGLAKVPGSLVWGGMKESARRASHVDAGNGYPGGAWHFAERLAALVSSPPGAAIGLHAIGHSAGAIFHSHLLPTLVGRGLEVQTVSLLAPAVRTDLFKERLLPHVGAGVRKLSLFTMEEDAERQDDCWKIYRKSLLYFVSRSFEGARRRPILGLHESIRDDADLRALFGIDEDGNPTGGAASAEIQFSFAPGRDPNPLTQSLQHGAFDNDPYTMSAALRRILSLDDATGIGFDDFPWAAPEDRGFEALAGPVIVSTGRPEAPGPGPGGATANRRALCVGINAYADRPLAGCVHDAKAWGALLEDLGFAVDSLFDQRATREAMLDRLRGLVSSARAGDVVVFQYSGHGTQLPDTSGDERDAFDEACVPIDYRTGAFLTDDDIAAVLAGVQAGVLVTLFMDCCHSGTISRFAPAMRAVENGGERVRYLPIDAALEQAHREYRRSVRAAPVRVEQALPGVIHLAACRDDEYAWESNGQGDFTVAATALLADAVRLARTNEAFIRAVQRKLAARGRQHAMLMPPAAGMAQRRLLAPIAADHAGALPVATGRDAELLGHLRAMMRLVNADVAAGDADQPG